MENKIEEEKDKDKNKEQPGKINNVTSMIKNLSSNESKSKNKKKKILIKKKN